MGLIVGILRTYYFIRRTSKHSNADAISRLPLPNQPTSTSVLAELVLLIESLDEAPVTAGQIAAWTQKDTVLPTVM